MLVSVNPTYKCNMNCSFCYLKGLPVNKILTISKLKKQLKYLNDLSQITGIDLYGGEITILNDKLVREYIDCCLQYVDILSIVINGLKFPDYLKDPRITISVSWDYIYRDRWKEVLSNIKKFYNETGKKVSIIITSKEMYDEPTYILNFLNIDGIENFELKPCMPTKGNGLTSLDLKKYLSTCIKWANYKIGPQFLNKDKLINLIPYDSQDHMFINPDGELEDINFDGVESFGVTQVMSNRRCIVCPYYRNCFNEHPYSCPEDSYDCIGFKKYLTFRDWIQGRVKSSSYEKLLQERNVNYKYNDYLLELYYKNEIDKYVLGYIQGTEYEIFYPAKTYFVAYLYALLLFIITGRRIPDILLDERLLPNDPYFEKERKNIYLWYIRNRDNLPHVIDFSKELPSIVLKIFIEEFGK